MFGTVLDWRAAILREGRRLGKAKGLTVDWGQFADRWRGGYQPAMDRVRRGELPWTNFDRLQRLILDQVLEAFHLTTLSESEKEELNRVWRRLPAWPDMKTGLRRLRRKFVVAALSNGNMAMLTDVSKYAGISWDCILSAELVKHYKPDREVYEMAVNLLGLEPSQVMMAAAHKYDLLAAKAVGLKTAFVHRPLEFGPEGKLDLTPDPAFDMIAAGFDDLADQLGHSLTPPRVAGEGREVMLCQTSPDI